MSSDALLNKIQSKAVRLAAETILDELGNEPLEAYISYADRDGCFIKFELEALGTIRVSNSDLTDHKYTPRWNVFIFPCMGQKYKVDRPTFWYSDEKLPDFLAHIRSYADKILRAGAPKPKGKTISDALAAKQQAQAQDNFEAYASLPPNDDDIPF